MKQIVKRKEESKINHIKIQEYGFIIIEDLKLKGKLDLWFILNKVYFDSMRRWWSKV